MNPTRRDPYKVCGFGVIEHENAPFDVTCTWCLITQGKPLPPAAPFMRIGDKGETVNPRTGERIPPSTTEWRRAPKVVCKHCIFTMGVIAGVAIMALFR